MGLFSSRTVVDVSSTLYNLAGDEDQRDNFLQTNLFSAQIAGDSDTFFGQTMVNNYLTGPGIRQRQFQSSALRNDYVGLPSVSLSNTNIIDSELVRPFVPVPSSPPGLQTQMLETFTTDGDFSYFAEQHIAESFPELLETNWVSEYDTLSHTITIQYEDGSTEVIPGGIYSPDERYLVTYYFNFIPGFTEDQVIGPIQSNIDEFEDLPSTDEFEEESFTNTTNQDFTLNRRTTVTTSFSNGSPDDVTVNDETFSQSFIGNLRILTRSEFLGIAQVNRTRLDTEYRILERREVGTNVTTTVDTQEIGGVTQTTTTVVQEEFLDPIFDYQINTQIHHFDSTPAGTQLFIYQIGSGNSELDALVNEVTEDAPEFYPFIPVRINNNSINDDEFVESGLFDEARDAYRRATNRASFQELIESIEDNEDIEEIDYAYVDFGVSLNTKSNSSKKYIHQFLRQLIPHQNTTAADFQTYISGAAAYRTALAALQEWQAQNRGEASTNTEPPSVPFLADPQTTTIRLSTEYADGESYDIRLTWVNIEEEIMPGVHEDGANPGDCRLELGDSIVGRGSVRIMHVYCQLSDNTYSRITTAGLLHRNFIFGGNFVQTDTHDALNNEDDESSFLIPMHQPTIRSMSLVDSTQVATENTYIVINTFTITRQRFFERGIFRVIVFVAIIVVSVLINPVALGAATGFLGTNLAVGAAIGLTGTAAIIAGAAVNAIVGLVVAQILTIGATELFGDELGAIIGAVATFAVGFVSAGGLSNFTFGSAESILSLSSVFANGYRGFTEARIANISEEIEDNQNEFDRRIDEINELLAELNGTNSLSFNPLQLTDVNQGNGQGSSELVPEGLDEFIRRTTLTGSDIVDITLSLVKNYPELARQLPRS